MIADRLATDADISSRLSAPALRLFERVASLWGLSVPEKRALLGGMPESTYFRYMKSPEAARLSRDTLDRISHVVGIYKALNVLLPRPEAADAWVRRPNAGFGGQRALDIMLRGGFEDLAGVRHYLDGERGR